MSATFEERLVAGLLSLGYFESNVYKSKSRRFIKIGCLPLFVGRNGGLRQGECLSRSLSMGCPAFPEPFFNNVLAAGDKALAQAKMLPDFKV